MDGSEQFLEQLAESSPEVLEAVVGRHIDNIQQSGLDPRAHSIARLAALIAVGAPSASYGWQVSLAREAGLSDDEIAGVLVAVAPAVGLPRAVAAAPLLTGALRG